MGDLRVCYPNGDISREDRLRPSHFPLSLSNADQPCSIARESWETAEETTRRIVWSVQPTLNAETKRKEVIQYVQGLIQDGLGYKGFPYGSVPLKTYLPDGDIDLTTLVSPAIEDTLVSDVHAVLRDEEHNEKAPYKVKDVHCIDAEVKLVKCLVENIVVDISFNQLGGLCTLWFLEQVDRLVGKDHLFKRSIILIKAWCYYESRILGAHHGLISTYALETLVLCIFHLFHSSLNGPIAVLYRFLDYFSKFDWENYCISLNGPVSKSSLPDIVAEVPVNMGNDPLLSEEFLRKCINMFSFPSSGVETNAQLFPLKHLNIIDPLKENNNLGRSVNKGNYYRIRSALKYGAQKLGQILVLPRERIPDELVKFFGNTLERQRSNHLTEVKNLSSTSDARGSDRVMPAPRSSMCSGNYMLEKRMYVGSSNGKKSGSTASSGSRNKLERFPHRILPSQVVQERKTNANKNAFSGYFGLEDPEEYVASGLLAVKSENGSSDYFCLCSNLGASLSAQLHIHKQNGRIDNDNSKSMSMDSIAADDMNFLVKPYFENNLAAGNLVCKGELAGTFGDSASLKSLLDLTGDYDDQFWSVLYGQYCHLLSVSASILPSPSVSPPLPNEDPWETVEQSIPLKPELYSQRDSHGILGPQCFFSKAPAAVRPALDSEDKKKQGIGTYVLNLNCHSNLEKPSYGTGTYHASRAHRQFQRYTNNNSSATIQQEITLLQEASPELSREEYPALGAAKFGSSHVHQPYPSFWGSSAANGVSCRPERFESKSCSLELESKLVPEDDALPELRSPCASGSSPSVMIPAAQSVMPDLKSNPESDAGQSYHLKDEHDFPPLSWEGYERRILKNTRQ